MHIDVAVSKLPPIVRIGPFDFKVKHDDKSHMELEAGARYGSCDMHTQTICVRHNFASHAKVVDTFLHECFHAIYWAYGINKDDGEERNCRMLGIATMALHRDNRWLTTWIDECMEAKT